MTTSADVRTGPTADEGVDALVRAAVRQWPDADAVRDPDGALTYRELWRLSGQIAAAVGDQRPSNVGVLLDRSRWVPAAWLGVLRAGNAYVPLDPAAPNVRLQLLLRKARVRTIVSERRLFWRIPPLLRTRAIAVDDLVHNRSEPDPDPQPKSTPETLAYVIFTSGSTGEPKGVAMPHGPLRNLVVWQLARSVRPMRTLQFAPLTFDVAFQEVFSTLAAGACLFMIPEAWRRELGALPALLDDLGITRAFLPPVVLRRLADVAVRTGCLPRALAEVAVAGEALRITPAIRDFFTHAPMHPTLENHYGPTETHVATAYQLPASPAEWPDLPPIGLPLPGVLVQLHDERGELVAGDRAGEIHIGGIGVARGYVNARALTRARFRLDSDGVPWYRTGDLACWRRDGNLEFLGRRDDQVKIRGFRIEPGEIDAAVEALPGVRAAATVAVRRGEDAHELVTFYVRDGGKGRPDHSEERMRSRLEAVLPNHVLPQRLIPLAALPLSTNGKVDRGSLRARFEGLRQGESPGSDGALEVVLRAMRRLLGRNDVAATSDFFECGGDSLAAADLALALEAELETPVRVSDIFERPTAARLVHGLQPGAARSASPMRYAPSEPSASQVRLLLMEQLVPGTGALNVAVSVRLHGKLHVPALRRALRLVVWRHDSLHTAYVRGGLSTELRTTAEPILQTAVAQDSAAARRVIEDAVGEPFDLSHGLLLRALLVTRSDARHELVLIAHHVAADGRSIDRLATDLLELYAAERVKRTPDLAYLEPVRPREPGSSAASEVYWRSRLGDLDRVQQVLCDYSRPSQLTLRAGSVPLRLPRAISRRVREVALRLGVTPFTVLVGAWHATLGSLTRGEVSCVGIPVARQQDPNAVGMFVQDVPLIVALDRSLPVTSFLRQVGLRTLEAIEHADLPFQRMVELAGVRHEFNRHPLFEIGFAYQAAAPRARAIAGLRVNVHGIPTGFNHLDLLLTIEDHAGALSGWLDYSRDLFDELTARRVLELYVLVLDRLTAGPSAQQLGDALDRAIAHQVRKAHRRQTSQVTLPRGLAHDWIAARARRRPQHPAVAYAGRTWTYASFNDVAERLAALIERERVTRAAPVAIWGERSPELFAAMVGALKAGSPFVPIGTEYPVERQRFMLADSGATLVLAMSPEFDPRSAAGAKVVRVELESLPASSRRSRRPVTLGQTAYILYTSGSTGEPKGVRIAHRGLANMVAAQRALFRMSRHDRVSQFFSVSFDAAIFEMLLALAHGATLEVLTDAERADGKLADHLERRGITVATLTPTVLREVEPRPLPKLRLLISAGEACPQALVDRWAVGRRFINAYGPTEATIWATAAECRPARAVTIGLPIPGVTVHLFDERRRPVPLGASGEICIGGAGVGLGYVGHPELNARSFITQRFAGRERRFYRTGDLGRERGSGELDYLGRIDRQVKLRGYRIELGEIEAALRNERGVADAAVVLREVVPGAAQLSAYIVAKVGSELDANALSAALGTRLPRYMIPTNWTRIASLPRTSSGKLDERALPAPEMVTGTPPASELEARIASVWSELLRRPISRDDDFFDIGGHSLLAIQLVAALKDRLDLSVGVDALFRSPKLADFASAIGALIAGPSVRERVALPLDRRSRS